jgi:hypothetical protein
MLTPLLTVTLLFKVGCEAPETTRVDPPLAGVLKAKVSLPMLKAYQVFLLHELVE